MNHNQFPFSGSPFPFFANPLMFAPPVPFFPSASVLPMMPIPGSIAPGQFPTFDAMSTAAATDLRVAYLQNQQKQLAQLKDYVSQYSKWIDEALTSIEAEISSTEKSE